MPPRFHVIDAVGFAGLLALIAVCFQQAGFYTGFTMTVIILLSAQLGYKLAMVRSWREPKKEETP